MTTGAATLDERLARLGREIATARARLAARADFEHDDVGEVLETINEDLEAVAHDNEEAAHRACDRIETRLAELQPLLGVLPR
jgi:hypothetical protein